MTGPIDWTPGAEIVAAPDDPNDAVCLPFMLVDSDQPDAQRIVTVPVILPPDWVAVMLLLADRYLSSQDHTPLTDPAITDPADPAGTAPSAAGPPAGGKPGDGTAARVRTWRTVAEFLLLAGIEHLAGVLPTVARHANADPDVFVRFESCRAQVRELFDQIG